MLVFEERGKAEYPEKNLSEQSSEQIKQSQPTHDADSGNRTRVTLVGGERSHHCASSAPLHISARDEELTPGEHPSRLEDESCGLCGSWHEERQSMLHMHQS